MGAAYEAAVWSDFAVGIAGAAAALTGLLFVAVSINLTKILEIPSLPSLAGQTLLLFLVPLIDSVFMLVPAQPLHALGVELLVTGVAVGGFALSLSFRSPRSPEESLWARFGARTLPATIITGGSVVAGVSLLAGSGGGLLWIVAVVVVALLAGLGNAWVLLVEIQR